MRIKNFALQSNRGHGNRTQQNAPNPLLDPKVMNKMDFTINDATALRETIITMIQKITIAALLANSILLARPPYIPTTPTILIVSQF